MTAVLRAYDEHDIGSTWIVDEAMARASHALVVDGGVWLVDPVDVGDALERASKLGTVAGVLQLLDRHERDCAAAAERFGVAHHRLPTELPGTPLEPFPLMSTRLWKEVGLWWPERRALVVAESLAANRMHTGGASLVGVHFLLRLTPPNRLRRYDPAHLLLGHGPGVHGELAAPALAEALDRARRDLPLVLLKLPTSLRG